MNLQPRIRFPRKWHFGGDLLEKGTFEFGVYGTICCIAPVSAHVIMPVRRLFILTV